MRRIQMYKCMDVESEPFMEQPGEPRPRPYFAHVMNRMLHAACPARVSRSFPLESVVSRDPDPAFGGRYARQAATCRNPFLSTRVISPR